MWSSSQPKKALLAAITRLSKAQRMPFISARRRGDTARATTEVQAGMPTASGKVFAVQMTTSATDSQRTSRMTQGTTAHKR